MRSYTAESWAWDILERAESYGLDLDLVLVQGLLADSRYMTQEEADVLLGISTSDNELCEEARLIRRQYLLLQCCRVRHLYGDKIDADLERHERYGNHGPKLPYHMVTDEQKELVHSMRGRSMSYVRRKTGLSERTIQKIWHKEI